MTDDARGSSRNDSTAGDLKGWIETGATVGVGAAFVAGGAGILMVIRGREIDGIAVVSFAIMFGILIVLAGMTATATLRNRL